MYSGQRKRKGGREGGSVSNDESCTVNDDSLKGNYHENMEKIF